MEWQIGLIDFFGRAYGWSKRETNEIYIEEALLLINSVKDEELKKKADTIMNQMITLSTSMNPNEDLFKTLSDNLTAINSKLNGHGETNKDVQISDNRPYWEVTELDRGALEKAKGELQKVESRRG